MKRKTGRLSALLLITGLLLAGATRTPGHTAELYVNDYAGVINNEDRALILSLGAQTQQETGAQIAVLTVDSLEGVDIESYALNMAESWGLGTGGEDNGVLLLLAVEDRLSRIEVGYGLEGTLTDVLTGRIQDSYMLPYYTDGDYSSGLREGYLAVTDAVYTHYNMERPDGLPEPQAPAQARSAGLALLPMLLILVLVLGGRGGFLPFLFLPRGGGRGGGGGSGGTFGGGGRFGGGGSTRRF